MGDLGHRLTLLPGNVLLSRRRQTGAGLLINKVQKIYQYLRTRKEKCQTRGFPRLQESTAKRNNCFLPAKSTFTCERILKSHRDRPLFRLTSLKRLVRNVRHDNHYLTT